MSGPGLLFVNSKITKPDLLSEDVFLKWYSDEHIEEVVETSGIKVGLPQKALSDVNCIDTPTRPQPDMST